MTVTRDPVSAGGTLRAVSLVGPAVVCLVGIFVMGSVHFASPPGDVDDKTAHFMVFGGLVLPFARATLQFWEVPPSRRAGLGAAAASATGAALEFWQALLPQRSAELLDWVADTAGAIAAALVLVAVQLLRGGPAARGNHLSHEGR